MQAGEGSKGRVMTVDRAGLGFLGFIFGGVTAAVVLVACTMVLGHVEGRWTIDGATAQIALLR
jgi:uncharacterized protein (DUF697 family)